MLVTLIDDSDWPDQLKTEERPEIRKIYTVVGSGNAGYNNPAIRLKEIQLTGIFEAFSIGRFASFVACDSDVIRDMELDYLLNSRR